MNDDVVLIGNGGGAGVLATDRFNAAGWRHCARPGAGGEARSLRSATGKQLREPRRPPGRRARMDDGRVIGDVIREVLADAWPGALLVNLNLPVIVSNTDPR